MQLERFSTGDLAPRERLASWNSRLWQAVAPFRTVAEDGWFEGEACRGSVGALHLLRIKATAHRLERTVAGAPQGQRGLIKLLVQQHGASRVCQSGRELALESGMWTICDADRPFSVVSEEDGEQLVLLMPRERFGLAGGPAAHVARGFGDTGGTGRLLPRYLAGLLDEIAAVDDSNCAELADMATQLVRLALLEARYAAPAVSMRETLRLRVKDYVRRNLRHPDLSLDRIAAAFGCTKRHLHKVFHGEETTLSQFIWSQRLERCSEALRDPRLARHSITEIAFMWGFNNSGHFSKAFKERFGCPPGCFRERGAIVAAPLVRSAYPACAEQAVAGAC